MDRWQVFMYRHWVDFTPEENDYIANAFRAGRDVCHVVNNGKDYVIDFRSTSLTSNRTGSRRPIRLTRDDVDYDRHSERRDNSSRHAPRCTEYHLVDDVSEEDVPAAPRCVSDDRNNARKCKKWTANDGARLADEDDYRDDYDSEDRCSAPREHDPGRRRHRYHDDGRTQSHRYRIDEDEPYMSRRRARDRRRYHNRDDEDDARYDGHSTCSSKHRLRDDDAYAYEHSYSGRRRKDDGDGSRSDRHGYEDDYLCKDSYYPYEADDRFDDDRRRDHGSRGVPTPHGRREICDNAPLAAQPRGKRLVNYASPTRVLCDDDSVRTVIRSDKQRRHPDCSERGSTTTTASRPSENARSDSRVLEVPEPSRQQSGMSVDTLESAPVNVKDFARTPRGSSTSELSSPRVARMAIPEGVSVAIMSPDNDDTASVIQARAQMHSTYKSFRRNKVARDTSSTAAPLDNFDSLSSRMSVECGDVPRDARYISQASSAFSGLSSPRDPPLSTSRPSAERTVTVGSRSGQSDSDNGKERRARDAIAESMLVRVTGENGMIYLVSTTSRTPLSKLQEQLATEHQLPDVDLLCDGRPVCSVDEVRNIDVTKLSVRKRPR